MEAAGLVIAEPDGRYKLLWFNGESLKVISRRLAIAVRPDTVGTEPEQSREHAQRARVQTFKNEIPASP